MDRHSKMQRLLRWLSFMPPLERIARSIALDYLSAFRPIESMIYYLNRNDELTCLAVYGSNDSVVGVPIPSSTWRKGKIGAPLALHSLSSNGITWSKDKKWMIVNLYAQSLLIGFIVLKFADPVKNIDELNNDAEAFSWSISLYIALRFLEMLERNESGEMGIMSPGAFSRIEVAKPLLSERQSLVLSGLVAKKTNSVIAAELGYSVSTVRHETMRIFEAMGVSDRVEAAHQAKKLGIT